jgi:lipoprotein-anchoring transpeptidase ErfK/SrfK
MQRRTFLKAAALLPFAGATASVAPAFADTTETYQGGQEVSTYTAGSNQAWTGWASSGGVGYTYVYLFSEPNTESTQLASIPVNTPVTVIGYSPGEILAPPNPLWYNTQTPDGTGWIYSGLVTNVQPVLLPASAVAPPPGPIPGPVGTGLSIAVSLSRQHLWAYNGSSVYLDTDVTTGAPDTPTPTGLYYILAKIPNFKFISPWPAGSPLWYPDSPTHYALQFRDDGYYIHDAPWRLYNGPGTDLPHLDPDGTVRAGSHGCINTQYAPIMALASWAQVGTPVNIID